MKTLYNIISGDEKIFDTISKKKALQQAIARLPEDQRNVLKLYYEKRMSIKEIARQLNYSNTTIYNKHYRALHALRLEFNPASFAKVNRILYGQPVTS